MVLVSAKPGTICTVVGTGEPSYAGDGGQAGSACLNEPKSIVLDHAGRLYIADSENHVIRKVELGTGIITTIQAVRDPLQFTVRGGVSREWRLPTL